MKSIYDIPIEEQIRRLNQINYRRGLVHGVLWGSLPWAAMFATYIFLTFR